MASYKVVAATAEATNGDHGCLQVLLNENIPQLSRADIFMVDHCAWSSVNCVQSYLGISSNKGFVAAMELSKRLLIERTPD